MTPDQREARDERISIMTVEGATDQEAHDLCDRYPELYGVIKSKPA